MDLIKHENRKDFWYRSPGTSTPFQSSNIFRDRILWPMSFFHLADNSFHVLRGAESHDPLFKLDVVYQSVLNRFATSYQPQQFLSINKIMVNTWLGNIGISVYNPNNPVKCGLRFCMLPMALACDSSCTQGPLFPSLLPSEHGTMHNIVMDLIRSRFGKGYILLCEKKSIAFLHSWNCGSLVLARLELSIRKGLPLVFRRKYWKSGEILL